MKSDDQLNSEAARAPGLLPALWLCAVVLLEQLAALSQAFPSKPIKVVARRSSQLPEVASLREQGVDMTARSWIGLFGSTGMPEGIARRVNDEIRKSMENADLREKYTTGRPRVHAGHSRGICTLHRRRAARISTVGRYNWIEKRLAPGV